jgi:hypothetical protein
MRSLLKESKVIGIALFGDGPTIQTVPMMIFLGSSPNNPFALIDIVDCTSEMAKGGKKDAKSIAGLLLDSLATWPVSTHVLTGRVAGLSSKSKMDVGSYPTHVCFRGQGFKPRYCLVSTDNASLYLKARYL